MGVMPKNVIWKKMTSKFWNRRFIYCTDIILKDTILMGILDKKLHQNVQKK